MNNSQKLHQEFVRLGGMRFKLKNRMLAILPEIYESGIWKKYAGTIVEYAGKYGEIAKTTVKKRLRLELNLKDKPFLREAIEKVGVHKVAMVAKIITPDMDKAIAEKLCNMSKMAVQSLSKEMRSGQLSIGLADGQPQPCKAVALTKMIELDEESTFLFIKLKKKFGEKLSDKEFLKLILNERERQEFPQSCEKKTARKSLTGETFSQQPRYVTAEKRRQIIQPTKGKCSYPNCNSPYEILHHVDRYSESKTHDSIIPLCKIHHEFAHNNLIENEKSDVDTWKLLLVQKEDVKISRADVLYKKYRSEAISASIF